MWSQAKVTVTRVPVPGADSTASPPPACSAACARSGSPNPVFFFFVVKNGSRTRDSVSAFMPLPSSLISTTRRFFPLSRLTESSILFASARRAFSAISRIWRERSSTSTNRLPAVLAGEGLPELRHGAVLDDEAHGTAPDVLGTVGVRSGNDRILRAIREPLLRLVDGHVLRYFHGIQIETGRDEPKLADDAEHVAVDMGRDHQAVASGSPGRLDDLFHRERRGADQKLVAKAGHSVFFIGHHLLAEGLLVVFAFKAPKNGLLLTEELFKVTGTTPRTAVFMHVNDTFGQANAKAIAVILPQLNLPFK